MNTSAVLTSSFGNGWVLPVAPELSTLTEQQVRLIKNPGLPTGSYILRSWSKEYNSNKLYEKHTRKIGEFLVSIYGYERIDFSWGNVERLYDKKGNRTRLIVY